MSTTFSDIIPDYIEASSPSGLRSLMVKTNVKYGHQFKYFDISSYTKTDSRNKTRTRWIAWYYKKYDQLDFEEAIENGNE
jgi:hypothetical protein